MIDLEHFPTSQSAQRMMSRISPIYRKSYVGKWLFQVMGIEWDDAWLRFNELRDQAFPETTTWAIDCWEQRYGIVSTPFATLEERRREVMYKRNIRAPMNPARVEAIIQTMTGFPARITENVADYTFLIEVFIGSQNFDYDSILKKLKRIKPSHQDMIMSITAVTKIVIRTAWGYAIYTARRCGTWPQAATQGGMARELVVVETGDGQAVYAAPTTGETVTGTHPQTATQGGVAEGELTFTETAGSAGVYARPCGSPPGTL